MSGFALIPAFFNAVGKNISTSDEDYQRIANEAARNRQRGMAYGQPVPQEDRESVSTPSKPLMQISDAMLPGSSYGAKMVFGPSLTGEKALYQPSQMPVAGGFAVDLVPGDSGDYHNLYSSRLRRY